MSIGSGIAIGAIWIACAVMVAVAGHSEVVVPAAIVTGLIALCG